MACAQKRKGLMRFINVLQLIVYNFTLTAAFPLGSTSSYSFSPHPSLPSLFSSSACTHARPFGKGLGPDYSVCVQETH